jgi:hypothetical protein
MGTATRQADNRVIKHGSAVGDAGDQEEEKDMSRRSGEIEGMERLPGPLRQKHQHARSAAGGRAG